MNADPDPATQFNADPDTDTKPCPKNCHQALKNVGLGSEIRKKPIPDPGFNKAPDPQHCCLAINPNTAGKIEKNTLQGQRMGRYVCSYRFLFSDSYSKMMIIGNCSVHAIIIRHNTFLEIMGGRGAAHQ